MTEAAWKQTPLGRLPSSWGVASLDDVAVKIQDGTHFSPKTTRGPRRYLTSKNIRFGFLDVIDSGWISEREHADIYRRCDVQFGDVLLTKDGANTGNAALNTLTTSSPVASTKTATSAISPATPNNFKTRPSGGFRRLGRLSCWTKWRCVAAVIRRIGRGNSIGTEE